MAIRFDQYHSAGLVTLDGDLRGDEAAGAFRAAVTEALDAGQLTALVVDCAAARFIDSRGLEALLWSRNRLGDAIGAVRLANLDADCRKIVEITRLDDRFEVHDDVQTALRASN